MERPDRNKYDRRLAALEAEIKTLTAKREKIWANIQNTQAGGSDTHKEKTALQTSINKLISSARDLRKEKDELFNKKNTIFEAQKKERDQLRAMRDSLDRFKTVEDIDNKIRELEYEQATSSSMSLTDVKSSMSRIKELTKMKGAVAAYDVKAKAFAAKSGAGDELKLLCNAKQKEVDIVSKQIGDIKSKLEKLDAVRDSNKSKVQPLRDELEKVKATIAEKYTEKTKLKAKWRKDNDVFFDHMNKVKKIKAQIRKAEDEIAKKEQEALRVAEEEEEAKRKPWLAEIALCDNLISYLKGCKPESEPIASPDTKVSKSSDDGDSLFGVVKKKKKKRNKKKKGGNSQIKHDMKTLSAFAKLATHSKMKLTTPKILSDIDDAIASLELIKEHYDKRPREVKKKKSSGETKTSGDSSSGAPAKGSKMTTSYGEVIVEEKRKDGVVVGSLPWGKIFISA